jgi:hypothetical protein
MREAAAALTSKVRASSGGVRSAALIARLAAFDFPKARETG